MHFDIQMGAAYYIVLEHNIDGLDTMMDGKDLLRHIEALDQAVGKLGFRPLSDFLSMPPDEVADFLDGETDIQLPPLKHFSAQEGLASVRALLGHTPVHLDHVVEDLRQCERILSVAAERDVRWHFQIDI